MTSYTLRNQNGTQIRFEIRNDVVTMITTNDRCRRVARLNIETARNEYRIRRQYGFQLVPKDVGSIGAAAA